MTRVVVIGNAGGGKSTLCRQLAPALGLPHHAVDLVQWRPGWVQAPDEDVARHHDRWLADEGWIIDGFGPWATIEERLRRSDTVVFVDLPLATHLWWATKRQIKSLFLGRLDAPEGCTMWRVTFRLYRMMWYVHRHLRPRLAEAIAENAPAARIVHIRTAADLKAFRSEIGED
ncbi:MAG: flagellar protein FlaR [Alphaproteobacteria bacterium]|nr:flagellar protein FlaR [Alphaproteobacteria bacterium]